MDAELIRFVSGADAFYICARYVLDTWCAGYGSDQRGGADAGSAEHWGRSRPRPTPLPDPIFTGKLLYLHD